MKVYEHNNPVDDFPTPGEIENHLEEYTADEFIEWLLKRKGEATRDYFVDRWGVSPSTFESAVDTLEENEIVTVKQY